MTDTGPVPGEGLPENAGAEAVQPPHAERPAGGEAAAHSHSGHGWSTEAFLAPATPVYHFIDQPDTVEPVGVVEDEDDQLLMPDPQGSWGDPQPVAAPPQPAVPAASAVDADPHALSGQDAQAEAFARAQEAQAEALAAGQGAADAAAHASAVPTAPPAPAPTPAQSVPPRRPLHMGPPVSDTSSGVSVRSLADRGPAPQPAPAPQGPATAAGPEYLDAPAGETPAIPAQQSTEAPVVGAPWEPAAQAPAAAAGIAQPVPPHAPAIPAQGATVVPADEPGELADLDREPVIGGTPQAAAAEPVAAEPVAAPPAVEEQPAAAPEEQPAQAATDAAGAPEPAAAQAPAADAPSAEATVAPEAPAAAEPPAQPEPDAVAAADPATAHDAPAAEQAAPEPVPASAEGPDMPEQTPQAQAEPVAAAAEAPAAEAAEAPAPGEEDPAHGTAAAEAEAVDADAAEADTADAGAPAETPAGSPAPPYDSAVRDAVHKVIRERRDIRNGFRPDPIPHEVLLRVLEAAHTAPSVGHSQPWDFVVIRSEKTREKMHRLAMAQREAYAKSLPKARAKQFRELKIEAILDTPVNIVVTADPTRGGRHTLGRHTQPQMAPYSSALAVENLWLAARAEGLGVGWVSFFDEREMVRELGLPEHLEVVAYLCVGYVEEFPEDPELVQAGWSKRRPLAWVVHEEEYGNRTLPGEEPHDLLEETLRGIRPLDAKALGEAWERQKRMTKPSGALGMLEIISAQLCGLSRQCPPPIPEPAAVAIFAGDHGVHAQGVTAWPQEVTAQMVANFLGGGAVCNAFANQVGAEVCVVDVGVASELPSTPGLLPRKVRPGTSDLATGPAMTREEAMRAIEVGIETARDLVAAGNKALLTGEMGIANTTASAALIAVYTGADPAEVTGRGTGINDEMHARKVDVIRRALELHQPDPTDPIGVLAAIGGLEHAAMVGLLLGGASLRTPVILDGVSAGAAALVARAIAPEALAACIAGHRSAEPGHVAALTKLGLRPLVDLDLRLGEGTGALLALPLVQSAARVMHEVATFDSAGVTEKG